MILATAPDPIGVSFMPDAIQVALPEAVLHDMVFDAAVAAVPAATLTLLTSAVG